MGEARKRGSYEQRKSVAIERNAIQETIMQNLREQRIAAGKKKHAAMWAEIEERNRQQDLEEAAQKGE